MSPEMDFGNFSNAANLDFYFHQENYIYKELKKIA